MRKLEWSPDALEDLDVIWSYIAEDNVERASSFVEELQAQARKKKFIRERRDNAEALSRLSRMNFFFLLSMPQTGTSQSQIYYPA